MIIRITQHSADVLDRSVTFASADGTNDGSDSDTGWLQGDTISSATVTLPSPLTVFAKSNTTTRVTFWMGGGENKGSYQGLLTIQTAGGRTKNVPIIVQIRDREA